MIVEINANDDKKIIDEFNASIDSDNPWISFEEDPVMNYGFIQDDKLIGAIQLEVWGGVLLELSIATLPEYRRKGIAKQLINHVINNLRDIGFDNQLLMTIDNSNIASINLAKSLGFELVHTLKEYKIKTYAKEI